MLMRFWFLRRWHRQMYHDALYECGQADKLWKCFVGKKKRIKLLCQPIRDCFIVDINMDCFTLIERFSFECWKVIGFAFTCTTLHDWLKKLAPLFHPIRSKTKTNRDSLVHVFPHFASATCYCNHFVFWLVHLIICVLCDWLEWLLWFWFSNTQLKTTLLN